MPHHSPITGSAEEVYVEVVPGLGEALVSGDYPGRALGGAVKRAALEAALSSAAGGGGKAGAGGVAAAPAVEVLRGAVTVVSYPSKSHMIVSTAEGSGAGGDRELVFMARSDSNAGARVCLECGLAGWFGMGVCVYSLLSVCHSAAFFSLPTANHPDSNPTPPPNTTRITPTAEDLPGCTGAGLFESHPSAPLPRALSDYAADPLTADEATTLRTLWSAALAAVAAERAVGGAGAEAQDVEGGIDAEGRVWVLQSRSQA